MTVFIILYLKYSICKVLLRKRCVKLNVTWCSCSSNTAGQDSRFWVETVCNFAWPDIQWNRSNYWEKKRPISLLYTWMGRAQWYLSSESWSDVSLNNERLSRLIYDELRYDRNVLENEHVHLPPKTTSEERRIYDKIMARVAAKHSCNLKSYIEKWSKMFVQ